MRTGDEARITAEYVIHIANVIRHAERARMANKRALQVAALSAINGHDARPALEIAARKRKRQIRLAAHGAELCMAGEASLGARAAHQPRRVVCAWCKALIREGAEPTSHGICDPCRERTQEGTL